MIWVHPTDMQDRTRPSLPFFILEAVLKQDLPENGLI
jgi:hypothetical protein